MKINLKLREHVRRYEGLVAAVREAHESRKMAHGHDFDHALAVANLAYKFSRGGARVRELAWLAGLFHNADRMIAADRGKHKMKVPAADVVALVKGWTGAAGLDRCAEDTIFRAVLDHPKPNNSDDSETTIALKDADRLVSTRLDVAIRAGQFHPELPVLDPVLLLNDVRGTFDARLTVVANLRDCLDWGNFGDERFCVRSPAAKKMIARRVKKLKKFLEGIIAQRHEEDLVPYPRELV